MGLVGIKSNTTRSIIRNAKAMAPTYNIFPYPTNWYALCSNAQVNKKENRAWAPNRSIKQVRNVQALGSKIGFLTDRGIVLLPTVFNGFQQGIGIVGIP